MYHKVGDFIRQHNRKLHLHIWKVIGAKLDENPVVEPIHSEPFSGLWETYNRIEKERGL